MCLRLYMHVSVFVYVFMDISEYVGLCMCKLIILQAYFPSHHQYHFTLPSLSHYVHLHVCARTQYTHLHTRTCICSIYCNSVFVAKCFRTDMKINFYEQKVCKK